MTTRTSGAPPPAADNENDADAGAVAGLASDARSMQPQLDEDSQACRELGEAKASDAASEVDGASKPSRLRASDLVSICEAYVARSVGTEGRCGGGWGVERGRQRPRSSSDQRVAQGRVQHDVVSGQRQDCVSCGLSGFVRALVGATWSFCGCYFRACWACLVSKGVFRACLNVSRPHAPQKGACCTNLPKTQAKRTGE